MLIVVVFIRLNGFVKTHRSVHPPLQKKVSGAVCKVLKTDRNCGFGKISM